MAVEINHLAHSSQLTQLLRCRFRRELTGKRHQRIGREGAATIAERRALDNLYKMVQACEWGAALSQHTAAAMARFCLIADIEIPQEEIDLLGGKPYRNAKHWTKRMLKDPHYIDHELVPIMNDAEKREAYGVPAYALAAYEVVIRKLASFAPIEKIRNGEITDIAPYITRTFEANWAPSKPASNGRVRIGTKPEMPKVITEATKLPK